jgi:hypothetical protein
MVNDFYVFEPAKTLSHSSDICYHLFLRDSGTHALKKLSWVWGGKRRGVIVLKRLLWRMNYFGEKPENVRVKSIPRCT